MSAPEIEARDITVDEYTEVVVGDDDGSREIFTEDVTIGDDQ